MAAKYIQEFATTAAFIAAAPARSGYASGFGVIGGVLYQNVSGTAVPVSLVNATETLTAARVLTAADSGKTLFLNSTTEFQVTLPALAAGLYFKFKVTAAPSGASYTIVAASGTPIHGFVLSKDLNGATDGGATAGTGVLTITLVDGKAQVGDEVVLECDGTKWYAVCSTGGNFDAITLS